MTKVTVFEYDLNRGPEVEVLESFRYAITYATAKLGISEIHFEVERTNGGDRVIHLDSIKGNGVIYETELITTPITETNPNNTPRTRRVKIRK